MDMGEFLTVAVVLGILFIGLPWIILHYITRWKQSASLTGEDEKLLDELHYTARRLEDRLNTIERIVSADHPEWKLGSSAAPEALDYDITRRN